MKRQHGKTHFAKREKERDSKANEGAMQGCPDSVISNVRETRNIKLPRILTTKRMQEKRMEKNPSLNCCQIRRKALKEAKRNAIASTVHATQQEKRKPR